MLIRYIFCLLTLVILSFKSSCQASFQPFTDNDVMVKTLLDGASKSYQSDIKSISGQNKKILTVIYKDRYETIAELFKNFNVITDPQASAYLDALYGEVKKGNPRLDSLSLRIVFSRNWWANASSMGEGTILFNIGLFHRLQNESEAVFALCHELAHYILDHGNLQIRQYVATIQSEDYQKQLKSIQKSEYRQNQQLESMALKLSFKNRRHSREFERAADSMALELMKNTPYDLNGALSLLGMLDTADLDKFNYPIELEKRFDFNAYHFKKSWTDSDLLTFAASKEDENNASENDSLKTHPDCALRIKILKDRVQLYNKKDAKQFLVSENRFNELKTQFDFEILDYCLKSKNVSLCLYYTLEMLHTYPDKVYLHTMVGKCLNEIYDNQKAHTLSHVVDLPGPDFDESYNKLLHLIQNVRLPEIAALSYYYMEQQKPAFGTDKDFNKEWERSRQHFIE